MGGLWEAVGFTQLAMTAVLTKASQGRLATVLAASLLNLVLGSLCKCGVGAHWGGEGCCLCKVYAAWESCAFYGVACRVLHASGLNVLCALCRCRAVAAMAAAG